MNGADMEIRSVVLAAARGWIGTPYTHQASLKGVGCDCLGLVRGVWRAAIGGEPEQPGPYEPGWAEAGADDLLLQAAARHMRRVETGWQGGDLLVFRWRAHCAAKHVAIATSSTHMIHAHDGACVCETPIGSHWTRRIAAVFAFPGA